MKICTHYGFGDYVICYGLIKELAQKEDITLHVIPHRSKLHIENIKRLYSSIPNVTITTDDPGDDVLYIGWEYLNKAVKNNPSVPFPQHFYDQVGLPIRLMWENFYFKRDIEKEKAIYESLGLKEGEYVFLHDDPVRGFVIDRKRIPDIKVVHLVDLEDISILDCLYIVERAAEVHAITTGLVAFIDLMNIKHKNLFLHRYVRPLAFDQPILKTKWKILN